MKIAYQSHLLILAVLLFVTGCAITDRPRSPHPSHDRPPRVMTDVANAKTDGKNRASRQPRSPIATVSYEAAETIRDDSDERDVLRLPEPLPPLDDDAKNPQLSADGVLTLDALEQMALAHNPSIRQAAAGVCQALGIRQQVGLKPNPTIGYFGEEIGNADSAGLQGAFISQTLVRGRKLAWNREVIGHDVDAARARLQAQRLRVRNDVRIQFFEALAAQRKLELARQFLVVAEQGVEVSQDLLEAQEGARPDVLQSEMQLSEVKLAIQRAEYELQGAWNELVALAGMPELPLTPLVGELTVPLDDRDFETTYAQIVASSPLMRAAYAQLRRAKANLLRQRVQPIPNLNGQLGAGHDDATGDEFANVQLSLPIPLHNRNQGNVRAAHAECCRARHNVERITLKIKRDLAGVMQEYQVAKATVEQYRDFIVPQADQTLELLLEAQQAGEFDFLRVFTARRMYYEANWEYVTALAELAKAETQIDGLLLAGGLTNSTSFDPDDDLRGQALSGR